MSKERARKIVRIASDKTEVHALKCWLLWDERGSWEKLALELLGRVSPETEKKHSSEEIDSSIASYLLLQAVNAMLEERKRRNHHA